MREHNGMRPHDIAILLKIVALGHDHWQLRDLSYQLGISLSEVSESLSRSAYAGLIAEDKKQVFREPLLNFLVHGLRYAFPVRPAFLTNGLPTAHSAPPLSDEIQFDVPYVWPSNAGNVTGLAIKPLYPNAANSSLEDNRFYHLLALADAIRTGRKREQALAKEMLEKAVWNEV